MRLIQLRFIDATLAKNVQPQNHYDNIIQDILIAAIKGDEWKMLSCERLSRVQAPDSSRAQVSGATSQLRSVRATNVPIAANNAQPKQSDPRKTWLPQPTPRKLAFHSICFIRSLMCIYEKEATVWRSH